VEITAYVVNNIGFYEKFNLEGDLLHPIDLLSIIEKY